MFALAHFPASAVVAWPASCVYDSSSAASIFEPVFSKAEPIIFALTEAENVEAVTYSWKPPAWQACCMRGSSRSIRLAVRALSDQTARPPLAAGSRAGFLVPGAAPAGEAGKTPGCEADLWGHMFGILFALVSQVLPQATQSEFMNIYCKRLATFQNSMQISEEYAGLGEAVQVLAREDQEDLINQKKATENVAEQAEVFKAC